MTDMPPFTWDRKACPCSDVMGSECQRSGCMWEANPNLVPFALRKPRSMTDLPPLPEPDAGFVDDTYRFHSWHLLRSYGDARAAAEREACAKVCDEQRDTWVDGSDQWGNPCPARVRATPAICAAAIRARGEA